MGSSVIERDAFRAIIPILSEQLQIDTGKVLANNLFSKNLLSSTSKWRHILSPEGGGTEQKANDLLVALHTEIEVDSSKVIKLITILQSIKEYCAIGKQLEGKLHQLRSDAESSNCVVLPGSHNADVSHQSYQTSVKMNIVLIGEASVGKTSITRQLIEEIFEERCRPTIGLSNCSKTMIINGRTVSIDISDTAGTEKCYALFTNYYRKAVGAFLVFSIADVQSFKALSSRWFEEAKKSLPENGTILLLANKCDTEEIQVQDDKIKTFAEKNGLKFFKTSAKTGEGIDEALEHCVKECLNRIDQGILVNPLVNHNSASVLEPITPVKNCSC